MPQTEPAAFAQSLAALDGEAFVRFVAALELARDGVRTVERDGGVLVVRGTRTRRLLPVAARRGPFRSPTPVGPVGSPVDEVVAQVDADASRSLAARYEARHRTPADLRDLTLYGLDRTTGRRLLAEHLDATGPTAGVPLRAVGLAGLVALAVFAVAVGAGVETVGVGTDDPPSVLSAVSGAETGTVPVLPGVQPTDRGAYPPGLAADEVLNPDALADAHRAAATDRSYRWVVVAGRTSTTWGGPVDVRASGPTTVIRTVAKRPDDGNGDGTFRTYANENYTYVGIVGSNGTQYSRERVRHRAGVEGRFDDRAAGYVARYLATPTGSVTPVEAAGTTVYRVRAAGEPVRLDTPVSNYTASAVVTREGFVVRLNVAYTRHREDGIQAVAFRFRYAPYRDDARTQWHDAAQRAANSTTTPAPGAEDGDPTVTDGSDARSS